MRARVLIGIIGAVTVSANILFGVDWMWAVGAGLAVVVVGEIVGRLGRAQALPGAAVAAVAAEPTPAPGSAHPLSQRELEVAVLIARGLTSKEVGVRLSIEKGTVDKHLEHIKDKLGISSRPQLAVWLMERGLLQPAGTAN